MDLKFIEQGNAKAGTVNVDIPAGKYAGLMLRISGVTDIEQTLALDDIGHIRFNRFGEQQISENWEFFNEHNDLKFGYLPTVSGGAAADEDVIVIVPFYLPELPNIAQIKNNEEADLKLEFDGTTLGTRFGTNACTYEVYGIMLKDVAENYYLRIKEQDKDAAGAGRYSMTINGRNTAAVYISDTADKIDSFSLDVDGINVVDNIDDDVIGAVTSAINRVESNQTLREVNLAFTGNFAKLLNNETTLELEFNAAGTAYVTVFQIVPK